MRSWCRHSLHLIARATVGVACPNRRRRGEGRVAAGVPGVIRNFSGCAPIVVVARCVCIHARARARAIFFGPAFMNVHKCSDHVHSQSSVWVCLSLVHAAAVARESPAPAAGCDAVVGMSCDCTVVRLLRKGGSEHVGTGRHRTATTADRYERAATHPPLQFKQGLCCCEP